MGHFYRDSLPQAVGPQPALILSPQVGADEVAEGGYARGSGRPVPILAPPRPSGCLD